MAKDEKTMKVKLIRPMIYNKEVQPEKTVLTVPENEAKLYIKAGKAVPADPQKK